MKRIFFLTGTLCLVLALGPCAQAGASNKKKDLLTIRIHGEASPEDGPKFSTPIMLLDGRRAPFSVMPLLTEHEVKTIYPFKAPDGSGGVYLFLDGHGANLLTEYSIEKMGHGSVMAVLVNGRQVIDLLVDAPVRDGRFVIPSGLTMAEEARLVNAFPIYGQENSPAQKKKKQPFSPTDIMLPPKASDLRSASAPAQ
jgi:hypothetical protein